MPKHSLADTVKQMQARKAKANRREPNTPKVLPTPEQEAKNPTQSQGMARRITPMIDMLLRQGRITADEHDQLSYYRQQAIAAERSPIKSNLNREISGSEGNGPSLAITSAKIEVSRLNGILGNLRGICEAVVRDDMSLTQWTCEQFGSREKRKGGKVVAMVPRLPDDGKEQIDFGRWELKFAASRIAKYRA